MEEAYDFLERQLLWWAAVRDFGQSITRRLPHGTVDEHPLDASIGEELFVPVLPLFEERQMSDTPVNDRAMRILHSSKGSEMEGASSDVAVLHTTARLSVDDGELFLREQVRVALD